ncbi:MAG TPA: thioredoxin domain-containing protein [Terriglobales bacterium]|nr:thioredoxin domain-containing protein [Terriglobales bacterium]
MVCLGCAAQSSSPDLDRRIERQIRAQYDLPPKVNVALGPKAPSPDFPGWDAMRVTISLGEQKMNYDFLLSKDGKTLIRTTKMDLSKDPYADALSKMHIEGRPTRGNKDAKVTIVNYDDFQCPYCAMMHDTLTHEILKEYGDKIKLVYRDFPLTEIHPWAKHAAIDANCLAAQNASAYWNFADEVHANAKQMSHGMTLPQQTDKLDQITIEQGQKAGVNLPQLQGCVKEQKDDYVRASMDEAQLLGVEATPTMFINGQKVSGAIPADELKAIINRALVDAGETVPAAASPKPAGGM